MGKCRNIVIFATLVCGAMGIITEGQNGSQGPLHRAKRYASYPRVPLAYMNKVNPDSILDEGGPVALPSSSLYAKRFLLGREQDVTPVSHFREFRQGQADHRPELEDQLDASLAGYPMLARRSARRNSGTSTGRTQGNHLEGRVSPLSEDLNNQLAPLSDEDLQTMLLLLDGYALTSQGNPTSAARSSSSNNYKNEQVQMPPMGQYYNPSYLSPEDLRRVARMYAMGKREKDQGQFFELEQPSSLDNNADNRIEFITAKRTKRVGPKSSDINRFKKETDPAVAEELEQIFSPPRALPLAQAASVTTAKVDVTTNHGQNTGHTAATGQGQIPAPGASSTIVGAKPKKSVDWSEYFGIDKKSGKKPEAGAESLRKTSTESHGEGPQKAAAVTSSPQVKPKTMIAARITEPSKTNSAKESKEHKKLRVREENETENKSDRKWILNEFYKNLAMSTNVKRKRETNSVDEADELADLEQKMESNGDDIIWNALQQEEPTPHELAQIKKDIIDKLAASYSLEKLREAVDTFRDQLAAVKTNNV